MSSVVIDAIDQEISPCNNALSPEIQGMSIAVLGDFNPAIMHPRWFADNELIRENEANNAEIEIVHKNVAAFRTESVAVQVTQDRFIVVTEDPTMFLPLRDLVLGTFSILEHTPIRAFGVNRFEHVEMPSEEDWHDFGNFYVPKLAWNHILQGAGMKSVTVSGQRNGAEDARIEFQLQPSPKAKHGVFIHLNEHYDISRESTAPEAMRFLLETIQGMWQGFESYWEETSRYLLAAHRKVEP